MPEPVRIQAPRKRAARRERVREKLASVRARVAGFQNVPAAQLARAVSELADAVDELRELIEPGGGR